MTIAALFVQTGGAYFGIDGVDPYNRARNAMTYAGPHPVVAHPPCTRWCKLSGLVEARWGYKRGDDGGAFAHALDCVRRFGGVLEHPAYSQAWPAHGLARPPRQGGWVQADDRGGYTCHVDQGKYGHEAKKATWLYACGVRLPDLLWGSDADAASKALVSWCGNTTKSGDKRKRLSKKAAAATPPAFRSVLLSIASSAQR